MIIKAIVWVLLRVTAPRRGVQRSEYPDQLQSLGVLQAVAGFNQLRTDQHGWIELSTHGKKLWVEAEKSPKR